jgi:hypothetical protein
MPIQHNQFHHCAFGKPKLAGTRLPCWLGADTITKVEKPIVPNNLAKSIPAAIVVRRSAADTGIGGRFCKK